MTTNRAHIGVATVAVLCLTAMGTAAHAENCATDVTPGLTGYKVGPYTVLAYIPETAVGVAVPLVVNLHPSGSSGLETINESKHIADQNGFIMIAPTGVIGPISSGWTWNVPGVPIFGSSKYPDEDARDDVDFIDQAIDGAVERMCINTNRIYALGFSGGGRMASQLACDLSERLASVVAIGGIRFPQRADVKRGLPHAVQCDPARSIPVQMIHGHWDATNPWHDDALGDTPFVKPFRGNATVVAKAPVPGSSWSYSGQEALARWLANNGCDAVPDITKLAEGIERRDYAGCTEDAEVSLVFFENLGHAVPGFNKPWAPEQANSPIDGYGLAWELLADDRLDQ